MNCDCPFTALRIFRADLEAQIKILNHKFFIDFKSKLYYTYSAYKVIIPNDSV